MYRSFTPLKWNLCWCALFTMLFGKRKKNLTKPFTFFHILKMNAPFKKESHSEYESPFQKTFWKWKHVFRKVKSNYELGTIVIRTWHSFLVWSPPWYCNRYLFCYKAKQFKTSVFASTSHLFGLGCQDPVSAYLKATYLKVVYLRVAFLKALIKFNARNLCTYGKLHY